MSPLAAAQPTDAWGREVTVSNGLLRYRNRAIDLASVDEYRVKGKRVFINYYKGNTGQPKAIIICKDVAAADALYEYILGEAYYLREEPNVAAQPTSQSQSSYYRPLSPEELQVFVDLSSKYLPKFFDLLFTPTPPPPPTLWSFLGCGRR